MVYFNALNVLSSKDKFYLRKMTGNSVVFAGNSGVFLSLLRIVREIGQEEITNVSAHDQFNFGCGKAFFFQRVHY